MALVTTAIASPRSGRARLTASAAARNVSIWRTSSTPARASAASNTASDRPDGSSSRLPGCSATTGRWRAAARAAEMKARRSRTRRMSSRISRVCGSRDSTSSTAPNPRPTTARPSGPSGLAAQPGPAPDPPASAPSVAHLSKPVPDFGSAPTPAASSAPVAAPMLLPAPTRSSAPVPAPTLPPIADPTPALPDPRFAPMPTTWLNPTPFGPAQSTTARASEADCVTSAMLPAGTAMCDSDAFSPSCGTASPNELGPITRTPCAAASDPRSATWLTTTAARPPAARSAARFAPTCAPELAMTARSGADRNGASSTVPRNPPAARFARTRASSALSPPSTATLSGASSRSIKLRLARATVMSCPCRAARAAAASKARPAFLKKSSKKLLVLLSRRFLQRVLQGTKFFGSFFQKRTACLPYLTPLTGLPIHRPSRRHPRRAQLCPKVPTDVAPLPDDRQGCAER